MMTWQILVNITPEVLHLCKGKMQEEMVFGRSHEMEQHEDRPRPRQISTPSFAAAANEGRNPRSGCRCLDHYCGAGKNLGKEGGGSMLAHYEQQSRGRERGAAAPVLTRGERETTMWRRRRSICGVGRERSWQWRGGGRAVQAYQRMKWKAVLEKKERERGTTAAAAMKRAGDDVGERFRKGVFVGEERSRR